VTYNPSLKFLISDYSALLSSVISPPPSPPHTQFVTPLISRLSFSIIISSLSLSLSLCPFVYFNFCPTYLCHIIIRLASSSVYPSFKFMLSQAGTFVPQNLYYRNLFLFSYCVPLINVDLSCVMNIFCFKNGNVIPSINFNLSLFSYSFKTYSFLYFIIGH